MAASRSILVHPLSWRSRHLRAWVALVALVLVARWVWGWHARRTLQAQHDEIRRRGEPATLVDLKFDGLSDAENAWALQTKAAKLAQGTGVWSPSSSNDQYRDFPPYPGYWTKRAAASEAAHGQVFALARQARGLTQAQVRTDMTRPAINSVVLPTFNSARHLSNTLKDGALYAHVQGDDVEAVERVRDELHVARSLHADPTLVSQLVAIGIGASSTHAAQVMAPGLRLEKPGTRQAVKGLVADLLDESANRRGLEAGLAGERVMLDDFIDWSAGRSWFMRPMADMEAVQRNRLYAVAIEAAAAPDWPAASALLERAPREPSPGNALTVALAGGRVAPVVPRYSRFMLSEKWDLSAYSMTHFRHISDRRMTAVSLAVQLYRADHGRWPARLEELVPAYLAELPADPYRGDGGPLGYVVEKLPPPLVGDRPLVFAEDTTLPAGINPEPMYGFQTTPGGSKASLGRFRQYRDLSRFEPPASPEAIQGDPQKPGAPRGEAEKSDSAQ
jgi:hypothetical protein